MSGRRVVGKVGNLHNLRFQWKYQSGPRAISITNPLWHSIIFHCKSKPTSSLERFSTYYIYGPIIFFIFEINLYYVFWNHRRASSHLKSWRGVASMWLLRGSCGFDLHWGESIIIIIIIIYTKIRRWVPPVNNGLKNSVESGEPSVLTLGSLLLPRCGIGREAIFF